jgi:hypothetical protein
MMEKVSQAEIDIFFNDYVYGFIAGDVQREIDRARSGIPAGNFLCALALLCYTEVLGGVQRGTSHRARGARTSRPSSRRSGRLTTRSRRAASTRTLSSAAAWLTSTSSKARRPWRC